MSDYQVRLEVFEGPMDLLVYLIRKHEIDIYDIPIALIADQYMQYVTSSDILNLEQAGDFLLMAATLLHIKSRMLLPRPEIDDEDYEDPRTELVEKIVEYLQFKEIAEHMRSLEALSRRQAERGLDEMALISREGDAAREEDPQIDATINDLILAFGRFLAKKSETPPVHRVVREKISTAQRVGLIRKLLAEKKKVLLSELAPEGSSRLFVVVTLVALLEMARQGEIRVEQNENFSEIWIARAGRKRIKSSAAHSDGDSAERSDGGATDQPSEKTVDER